MLRIPVTPSTLLYNLISLLFIGFTLGERSQQTDYEVDFAIGTQGPDTPLNLLLNLDKGDLTQTSKERIAEAFTKTILTEKTLRQNRHVSFEIQNQIALEITNNLDSYKSGLSWTRIPNGDQLLTVCNLIYNHLEKHQLNNYGIYSGKQLAWHLTSLQRNRKDVKGYLQECIEKPPFDRNSNTPMCVSDTIDNSLRLVRNVILYKFPRDLMVIDSIQKELFDFQDIQPGKYAVYSSIVENLFLPKAAFALDEYGLPLHTIQKLSKNLTTIKTLDDALIKLCTMTLSKLNLTEFESNILSKLQGQFQYITLSN